MFIFTCAVTVNLRYQWCMSYTHWNFNNIYINFVLHLPSFLPASVSFVVGAYQQVLNMLSDPQHQLQNNLFNIYFWKHLFCSSMCQWFSTSSVFNESSTTSENICVAISYSIIIWRLRNWVWMLQIKLIISPIFRCSTCYKDEVLMFCGWNGRTTTTTTNR